MAFENWSPCYMYTPGNGKVVPREFHIIGSPHDPICNYVLEAAEKKYGEYVRFYDSGSSYSIEATRTLEQNTYRIDTNRILDSMADTNRPTPITYTSNNPYQNQVQVQLQGQGQVQAQVQLQSGQNQNQGQAQIQGQDSNQAQNQAQYQNQTQAPNPNSMQTPNQNPYQGQNMPDLTIVPLSQRTGFPRVFFKDEMGMFWFFPIVGRDRWWDDLNGLIKVGRGPLFFLQNNIRNALLPNAFPKTPPLFPSYSTNLGK